MSKIQNCVRNCCLWMCFNEWIISLCCRSGHKKSYNSVHKSNFNPTKKKYWRKKVNVNSVPWLESKMLTFLVNLELWCPPPWRSPPSRHSLPLGSHIMPPYERLQGIVGSVVQERISVSYTSKAFTGRLQWRPPEQFRTKQGKLFQTKNSVWETLSVSQCWALVPAT